MVSQSCHNVNEKNKLTELEQMGFDLPWKLVYIGLHGDDMFPPLISHNELLEYLYASLSNNEAQAQEVISLLCEENDTKVDLCLTKLVSMDKSSEELQKRKWRAYLLKNLLENSDLDPLQGILQLMEFWAPMRCSKECPMHFPESNDSVSLSNYFSQTSYATLLTQCSDWLTAEVQNIIQAEGYNR